MEKVARGRRGSSSFTDWDETHAARSKLTRTNLEDLYRAFAVPAVLRPVAALPLTPFARRFAETLQRCDARVAEVGLQRAMEETLGIFGVTVEAAGLERIPASGPLIVTANHPGLTDAPALLSLLARPDLLVLAASRSLFEALPALQARLITVDMRFPQRTVGRVMQHLHAEGALLTFPAGQIEPDPALDPNGAGRSLRWWSRSVELFCRLEPRTRVVPAWVSGVTTPETRRHPLTALHRDPVEKAWLAACLQVMWRRYQRNRVSVRFAAPLPRPGSAADLRLADVVRESKRLLETG